MMTEAELSAFLASARRSRFLDYLDPLGETAQAAFERRLSWARVSQHDPTHAEEAIFLLRHKDSLLSVLNKELDEDDWVEGASVGSGWGDQEQAWPKQGAMGEGARVTEIFGMDDLQLEQTDEVPKALAPDETPTPRDPSREFGPPGRLDGGSLSSNLEDLDDIDMEPTGIMRLEDLTEPPGLVRTHTPSSPPEATEEVLADILHRHDPGAVEAPRKNTPEELVTAPSAMIRSRRPGRSGESPAQTRAPAPLPSPVEEKAAPAPVSPPASSSSEREGGPPLALIGGGVALIVLLAGGLWASGVLSSAPPAQVAHTPAQPVKPAAAPVPTEVAAPVPVEAVPSEPEPAEVAPEPLEAAPAPDPVEVAPEPVAAPAPDPVEVAPEPEPVVVAPEPEPVVVAPEPEPVVVAPEPEPAVVVPEPEPVVVPEPVVAEVEPAEVAPVELPQAPPSLDVQGLWIGTGDGRSLKLTISGQGGDSFSGVAELELEDGSWAVLTVRGEVDPASKALSFREQGGSASFTGTVSTMRASGTYTLQEGHVPLKWSVVR